MSPIKLTARYDLFQITCYCAELSQLWTTWNLVRFEDTFTSSRSLTRCPDIYLHIVYLCIDAYYHQSVRIPLAIAV